MLDSLKQKSGMLTGGMKFGLDFIIYHYSKGWNKRCSQDTSIIKLRQYFADSIHYQIEFRMGEYLTHLLLKQTNVLVKNNFQLTNLLDSVQDYIISIFSYDDLQDKDLLRHKLISYHELNSPEDTLEVYSKAKNNLLNELGKNDKSLISKFQPVIEALEESLEEEDAANNYDLEKQLQTNSGSFQALQKKSSTYASFFYDIPLCFLKKEDSLNPRIRDAFVQGIEAAWLWSDMTDYAAKNGESWLDLKQGRIYLPLRYTIEKSKEPGKVKTLISQAWNTYKPIIEVKDKTAREKLAEIKILDKENYELFSDIRTCMMNVGTFDYVKKESQLRKLNAMQIDKELGGVPFLQTYLFALTMYSLEKRVKLEMRNNL